MRIYPQIIVIVFCCLFIFNNFIDKKLRNTLNQQIQFLTAENTKLEEEIISLKSILQKSRIQQVTVTAYSPRKGETDSDPYINASMQRVREGTIAISRDLFYEGWVFGRKVYIEGKGIFEIADLMHPRKTNQIDIFMFDTKKALKFGRKKLRAALLD